jgi:hypothetical protein
MALEYSRDTLLNDLRSNVVEVHFTKVNGEDRVMKCTLMPAFLPRAYVDNPDDQATERKFHNENPAALAVWDVDRNAWRSFRIDSVTYCQSIPYM